jgi:hypothetical protein
MQPAVLLLLLVPFAEKLITAGEEITFNLRNRSYLQIFILHSSDKQFYELRNL